MRVTTVAERESLEESRILLAELGYPTAAAAINDAMRHDSEERDAKETNRIEDEGDD